MSDLWMDVSNEEANRRLEAVTAVRVATASLWPILAGATDRSDFANRLELVRPRIEREAGSEELALAVEASLVNDYEMLAAARKTAAVSEQKRERAEKKGDTLPGTDKFPIENKKDLENAKHDIGRTNEPKAKVERYINERAKELGAPGIGGKAAARGPRCPLCGQAEDTDEHYDDVHANEPVPSHWSDPSNDWSLYDHHNIADTSYPANDAGMDVRRSAAAERQGRESSPFVREGATALPDDDLDDHLRDNHWHNTVHDEDIPCDHCGGTIPAGHKYLGNESTWDVVHSPKEAHDHMRRHWRGSDVWREMTSNEGEGDNPHYVGKNPHKERNRKEEHRKNLLHELARPESYYDEKLFCNNCNVRKDLHPGGERHDDRSHACDTPHDQVQTHSQRDAYKTQYKREFGDLPGDMGKLGAFHDNQLHRMRANVDHECDVCNGPIPAGSYFAYDPQSHSTICAEDSPTRMDDFDYYHRVGAKAITDEDISDAYENKHIPWAKANGFDPDTIKALREHEKSKGISRRMADGIADLTGIGGGGPDWRTGHHYEAALADVPVSHIPELNHVHTDHLTDDELMAHLRHEHGLNIQPYRRSNEHSHALDHLLGGHDEEVGSSHTHGDQYDTSYLDTPIQPLAWNRYTGHVEEVSAEREESSSHTAASNLYEPEYEEGLDCPHAPYCNWKGFSTAKRDEHIQSRHGGSMPGAKKSASMDQVTLDAVADAGLFGAEVKALPAGEPRRSFLSRMFRRAKNDENLKEKCPICGKEIPAAEMANHMKKDHPHQAVKPDDENRARDHAAEKKHKHHADLSTQTPSKSPLPEVSSATMAPEDDPSLTPTQDNSMPANLNPKTSARLDMIDKIAMDLYQANPGLTMTERIHLATKTVDRYPQLVAEARGGADYVDDEKLTQCTQCGKPAFSEESHHCHNCGFVRA